MKKLFTFLLLLSFVSLQAKTQETAANTKGLKILQINDVYTTLPLEDGKVGGLARVATLKKENLKNNLNTLLLLPGDFLSPSVASTVFKGKQMVDVLNETGVDIATLGNHEFDLGLDVLLERMKEARCDWVISNVIDNKTGVPVGGAKPYLVKEFSFESPPNSLDKGNPEKYFLAHVKEAGEVIKVGFIGLCLKGDEIIPELLRGKTTSVRIIDPLEAARVYIPFLEELGVDLIIALTHQNYADDIKLAQEFPNIDLIVGGHEHFPITSMVGQTLISKAGSDAKFVAEIELSKPENQQVVKTYSLTPMDEKTALDETVQQVALKYQQELDKSLDQVVGFSAEPLDAIAANVRSRQTNLGILIADAMRKVTKADLAILNSGAIRGDKIYPSGKFTKRDILSIHPFEDKVVKIQISGTTLVEALNHGVEKLNEKLGRYPQVSGLSFQTVQQPDGSYKIKDLKIGAEALDLNKLYTLAISDYMLQGGDGYVMLKDSKILIGEDLGELLVEVVEKSFSKEGITLK
ncbi:MAG: 5'-nucleotidase C-terminal domain-containing protein [Candidatus Caenarcaniphilales bacterium]|nr:5'-nucleotidase C-terminal domain-containing protein [Candidatus Caenarcaniphilales bacterium]